MSVVVNRLKRKIKQVEGRHTSCKGHTILQHSSAPDILEMVTMLHLLLKG